MSPTPGGLPGTPQLEKTGGGIAFWALVGCGIAMVIGGAMWGLATLSGNHHYASKGKNAIGGGIGGAVVVGAAAALVTFFSNLGAQVR